MSMLAIADLQGLGPKSQAMLAGAGIKAVGQLKRIGSVRAYAEVKATGANPSLSLLWPLEGATTGLPWQVFAKEHRLSQLLAPEALNGDAQPLAQAERQRQATKLRLAVNATFSPARAWRPTVARLART